MTWMARLLACSPAMLRSALRSGPQMKPPKNWLHSATATPLSSVHVGSESVSTDPSKRKPDEPVSTTTWSMAWQSLVPGTQTVTVANRPLR